MKLNDYLADRDAQRKMEAKLAPKGCKWCRREGLWRVDSVFWGPGSLTLRSYTQEMKSQIKFCPVCGMELSKVTRDTRAKGEASE